MLSSVTCVWLLSSRKTSSPDVMTSRDRKSTDSLGSLITFAVAMDTCFYLELLVLSFQPSFLTVTFSARLKGLLFYLVPCPLWLQMSVHFLHCNRRLKHFCSLLAILLKLNTESKVHCCTSHSMTEPETKEDPKLAVLVSRASVLPLNRKICPNTNTASGQISQWFQNIQRCSQIFKARTFYKQAL